MVKKPQTTFSIEQALENAQPLQRLHEQVVRSATRLQTVRPLLPPALRASVVSGAASDGEWCLLVPHHAAASKLRQLLPRLLTALNESGDTVEQIRVRVRKHG